METFINKMREAQEYPKMILLEERLGRPSSKEGMANISNISSKTVERKFTSGEAVV